LKIDHLATLSNRRVLPVGPSTYSCPDPTLWRTTTSGAASRSRCRGRGRRSPTPNWGQYYNLITNFSFFEKQI
jgi:hypothetical protein